MPDPMTTPGRQAAIEAAAKACGSTIPWATLAIDAYEQALAESVQRAEIEDLQKRLADVPVGQLKTAEPQERILREAPVPKSLLTTERHRREVAEGERDEAREALTDLLDVIDEQKIEGTCVTGTCHWPAVTREAWLGREALERDQAHRACPYCNYHRDHCAAEWNALTQEARTALVAARLCDG